MPSKLLFALSLLLVASLARAGDWQLDSGASSLSFVTIKAINIGEVHDFGSLSGSVTADGQAVLKIALDSVRTNIDIRDERMREHLFDTASFPEATIDASIDVPAIEALSPGASTQIDLNGTLTVKSIEAAVATTVSVTRLDADRVLVISRKPLVVYATSLGLAGGVEKLRELAGLPSISEAVPVNFSLTFHRARGE